MSKQKKEKQPPVLGRLRKFLLVAAHENSRHLIS